MLFFPVIEPWYVCNWLVPSLTGRHKLWRTPLCASILTHTTPRESTARLKHYSNSKDGTQHWLLLTNVSNCILQIPTWTNYVQRQTDRKQDGVASSETFHSSDALHAAKSFSCEDTWISLVCVRMFFVNFAFSSIPYGASHQGFYEPSPFLCCCSDYGKFALVGALCLDLCDDFSHCQATLQKRTVLLCLLSSVWPLVWVIRATAFEKKQKVRRSTQWLVGKWL